MKTLEICEDSLFNPSYKNICWNCKSPIDNFSCLDAGFDETGSLGYECGKCGKHLGHLYNPELYPDFQMEKQLHQHIFDSQS
jgi:hypothetical protein